MLFDALQSNPILPPAGAELGLSTFHMQKTNTCNRPDNSESEAGNYLLIFLFVNNKHPDSQTAHVVCSPRHVDY